MEKVHFNAAVGEAPKAGRRDSRLCHVVDSEALAHENGGAYEVNRPQEAVHFAGRNALAALGSDLLDQRKNFFRSLARMRREKKHWTVSQKFESVAQAFFVESAVLRAFSILYPSRLRLADGALFAAPDQIPRIAQATHRAASLAGSATAV